ncbi:MAG: hypothetical protein ACREVL_10955 [Solimonas sp.]
MKKHDIWRPRLGLIAAALAGSLAIPAAQAAPGDPLGPTQHVTDGIFSFASIGRGSAGDTVVAFSGSLGLTARRYAADGTVLGPDIAVGSVDYGPQPDVAVNAHGDFVVTWRSSAAGNGPVIYARRYKADGTALGDAVAVSEPAQPLLGDVYSDTATLAMDDDGDFVVGWAQGRTLETGNGFGCSYGIGICTSFSAYSARLRRYSEGGTQAGPVRTLASSGSGEIQLLRLPGAAGSALRAPEVAMAGDGSYAATWERYSYVRLLSPLAGVYAQSFSANGLPGLTRVVSLQQDNEASPSIAMDSKGGYVVTYQRKGIQARLYPASGGLGGLAFRVDDGTTGADQPAAAMDEAGNFVIAWKTGSGSPRAVRAQRYAAGGGPLGINFRVDDDISGDAAVDPSVASDRNGNFAIAWEAFFDGARVRFFEGP